MSTMQNTPHEWVHNAMGQTKMTNALPVRATAALSYNVEINEVNQDLNVLTLSMHKLITVIQYIPEVLGLGLLPGHPQT